ncbi:MAG: fumarate hydratase [Clostridiales bacterium]|jgi:fumarate hydratase subunit alpha|nr:fumarate hydratase [Clostridiales bacterium]
MKEICVSQIEELTARLCVSANINLEPSITAALAEAEETAPLARSVLGQLAENARVAAELRIPMCQDTGMAVVFLEIGQDARVTGGGLYDAVNAGVARGYEEGFLRKSVVADPLRRVNTGDNTPAVIHAEIVPGEVFRVTVAPKGFGSENMSALRMLVPADGRAGVRDFVLETVRRAGANPCPPIIVGVGVGGTFEQCALLAKKALLLDINGRHADPFWAEFEGELLDEINRLGFGPAGFGGRTTALGLRVLTFPTHIAGLPAAVNISCHATRHATGEL